VEHNEEAWNRLTTPEQKARVAEVNKKLTSWTPEHERLRAEAKKYGEGHDMESHGEGRSLEDLVKKRFHTKQTNAIRSGRTHGLEEYKKSDEFKNSKFGQDYLSRED